MIFKGGTSLSKGWNLIQRFSEDIDIFLDPTAFTPPLGKKAIDRELKRLRQTIENHPALKYVDAESQTIGGFGRNDRFEYRQRFAGTGDIRNRVFVEAGTASGREPTERIRLQSYVGQFLKDTGVTLGAEDEGPFEMRLLHFRRTFVEKMFAIHKKTETYKAGGQGDRRIRSPLLRPLLFDRTAGSPGHAAGRGVRCDQNRLRPDQPGVFFEELPAAVVLKFRQQRCPVPTAGSASGTGWTRHKDLMRALKDTPGPALGVTTQVCEMSLDIDVDLLVTEDCPVTSLVQRMGRCNRAQTRDRSVPPATCSCTNRRKRPHT